MRSARPARNQGSPTMPRTAGSSSSIMWRSGALAMSFQRVFPDRDEIELRADGAGPHVPLRELSRERHDLRRVAPSLQLGRDQAGAKAGLVERLQLGALQRKAPEAV